MLLLLMLDYHLALDVIRSIETAVEWATQYLPELLCSLDTVGSKQRE
jgi:hypothetical protein